MVPVKGKRYKRANFGITFPRTLVSSVEVNGEIYFFINIGSKYNNKRHNGGIIHEPKYSHEVVKKVEQITQTKHTFLRDINKGEKDFEYLGLLATVEPYDQKRNFLTFK